MTSIEKSQVDQTSGPIGVLDALAMRDDIKAIGYVMESDGKPASSWAFQGPTEVKPPLSEARGRNG